MPLISVIIPTLNSATTLANALDSVLGQGFGDFEIIVMDGVSTDNTLEIAKSYNDQRIRIFSKNDKGIYDAMNNGILEARGEWLYFLGSDDALFSKDVFESLYSNFLNKQWHVIYGNVWVNKRDKIYDGQFNAFKLCYKNICHQCIFTRRSVFEMLGSFDLRYHVVADWHFNMKWYNHSEIKHLYVDKVVAVFSPGGYCYKNYDNSFINDKNQLVSQLFPLLPKTLFFFRNIPGVRRVVHCVKNCKTCIKNSQAEVMSVIHKAQPK